MNLGTATKTERCPYCSGTVERTDKACPHCARSLTGKALAEQPPGVAVTPVQRVAVIDLNMPFGSMVGFMFKVGIAAIPAMFLLTLVYMLIASLIRV